jgi:hypothetical protein
VRNARGQKNKKGTKSSNDQLQARKERKRNVRVYLKGLAVVRVWNFNFFTCLFEALTMKEEDLPLFFVGANKVPAPHTYLKSGVRLHESNMKVRELA